MSYDPAHIRPLLSTLEDLIEGATHLSDLYKPWLDNIAPALRPSALNLTHYLVLRSRDIRLTQHTLGAMGLTRLGRAESHVMASLQALRKILYQLINETPPPSVEPPFDIIDGRARIDQQAQKLLGPGRGRGRGRIMVTIPTDAADDPEWAQRLVKAGMTVARINCAHDDPEVWARMIQNIKQAAKEHERPVKIAMDLAGPKVRTGPMSMETGSVDLQLRTSKRSSQVFPGKVWLGESPDGTLEADAHLPLPLPWVKQLVPGDLIGLAKVGQAPVPLRIEQIAPDGAVASYAQPMVLHSGDKLRTLNRPMQFPEIRVGALSPRPAKIRLHTGDQLLLTREPIAGRPATHDIKGELKRPAQISCTLPTIFDQVQVGEPVRFNDGKIEAIIKEITGEGLLLDITFTKPGGARLRSDKGINFPNSQLNIPGLTEKDRADLPFVAKHADLVNLSFVNRPQDVFDLLEALAPLKAEHLGIVLKIETRQGFEQLPAILLAAMRNPQVGVMIARGDLAVEVGWQELAFVQEEIARVCEAAHVPVIWATQVLETMAKKGRPSRAEITDAAIARSAECVMLNKGPHILEAVEMLGTILQRMEEFHAKTAPMLPVLNMSIPQPEDAQRPDHSSPEPASS